MRVDVFSRWESRVSFVSAIPLTTPRRHAPRSLSCIAYDDTESRIHAGVQFLRPCHSAPTIASLGRRSQCRNRILERSCHPFTPSAVRLLLTLLCCTCCFVDPCALHADRGSAFDASAHG